MALKDVKSICLTLEEQWDDWWGGMG
jgi:hypothetical protein